MKTVILAGGFGTRLSEETEIKPKPLVEIGGRPILWHIMKIYSSYGFNDFLICLGYRGYAVKEYFANQFLHMSDISIDLAKNKIEVLNNHAEPWKVTLIDTGLDTMTGGRLKRIRPYIEGQEFLMTYGDGVADIDLQKLLEFHRQQKRMCTVTAVRPMGRFGALKLDGEKVSGFEEKPIGDGGYINGGFFVLSTDALDYVQSDQTVWEQEPMQQLTSKGHMSAYKHHGFWQPMDTLRDRKSLEGLWSSGKAPWKVWK